ncbi:hypothetical protein Tco_1154023 [Tanacetum coccineum]
MLKKETRSRLMLIEININVEDIDFAMSSDNASSAVTYTFVSSDSNGPASWGIPLVNAGELSKMDSYEEVAQQGQAHPLSPAYVPDPMELDEHPYADNASLTAESPRYIADSDSMEEDTYEDSIDYPDEPKDGQKDDNEDPKEDPSEEHKPKGDDDDDDTDDEDEEPTKDEEEETPAPADSSVVLVVDPVPLVGDTKAFETDESAPTPRSPQTMVLFSQTRLCRAQNTIRLEPPMSTSIKARIAEHVVSPIPPTSPAYDQAPLGHKAAMIRIRDDILEEDMPPRRRFVLAAPPPGCDVAESSAAARAPRAADRAEVVGYVRALQTFEHRMMTSIEEVNLRVSYQAQVCRQKSEDFYTQLYDAQTDRRDIRLEIDIVKGQRTAYETELHEDDARHNSGGGLRRPVQPARVCSYTDFMKCQPLNFKGTKGVVGLSQWLKKMESVFHISGCAIDNQVKFATCTLLGVALTWWNGYVRTLGHDAAYAMTWGTLKKKLTDKYCPKGEIKKLEIEL